MAKGKAKTGDKSAPAEKRFNRGERGTHPLDKAFEAKPEGVVEVLGGDGLQTLTVTWRSLDEWQGFRENDFWDDLETILANCDAVMLRHGWNRLERNGQFPNDRTAEPFTELWYAGKIGFACWNLLNWHRVKGPNEIALSDAMYLGRLLSEAEWRAAFKPAIVTGKAQRKTLNEHREKAIKGAKDKAAARRALVAELMRETNRKAGALNMWLRSELEKRHGISVSERTIRTDKAALQSSADKLGKAG
jgi:hypothetical protein